MWPTLTLLGESLVKVICNDWELLKLRIMDVDGLLELLQFWTYPHSEKPGKAQVKR